MAKVENGGVEVFFMLMTLVVVKGGARALDVASGDACRKNSRMTDEA